MSRIYSHINLPAIALPSSTCLQWSDDGQLFILTKNSVYIMTPNYAGVLKPPPCPTSREGSLKWFRTMIEIEKQVPHDWAHLSEEWGTVVLGSFDTTIRGLALSPAHVAKDAGCLAAVLSSNAELSLWAPDKNRLQGKWTKIQDLNPVLNHLTCGESLPPMTYALQAQATSVTWSRQGDFDIDPAPLSDTSLVAVGTRRGTLAFLRFDQELSACKSCADPIAVSNTWVTQLAFSPWTPVERGKSRAFLACGDSHGTVEILCVAQYLTSTPFLSGFGSHFDVSKPQVERQIGTVIPPDKRLLTALTWICCKETMVLVAANPGLVVLWAPPNSHQLSWFGRRALHIQPQKISAGSSPLQSVSGVQYLPIEDVLIICLVDGSFHVVYSVSIDPSWTPILALAHLSSRALSQSARLAFCRTQRRKVRYTDVSTIRGMVPYDSIGTFVWVNELCQPTDLNYRYNTERHTMLMTVQLWKFDKGVFLRDLETIMTIPTSRDPPKNLLRPCFVHFSDHPEIALDVLKLLQAPIDFVTNEKLFSEFPPSMGAVTLCPTLQHEFRESLSRNLFGSQVLLRLRMRLVVIDALLRTLPKGLAREERDLTACQIFLSLSQIILHVLIHHLAPISTVLSINDVSFASRVINQSLHANCPAGLDSASTRKRLSSRIESIILSSGLTPTEQENLMKETCPACDGLILLENVENAVCGNGHTWSRCSITSFILSTGMIRKCVGCDRKAILPLSCRSSDPDTANWLPEQAQKSWVVEELLEAVNRCLFCGNIFVHAL